MGEVGRIPARARRVTPVPALQGMILGVSHPLLNEPGLGGFESAHGSSGPPSGVAGSGPAGGSLGLVHVEEPAVRRFDERTQVGPIRVGGRRARTPVAH